MITRKRPTSTTSSTEENTTSQTDNSSTISNEEYKPASLSLKRIVSLSLSGFIFGIAIEKSKVYLPDIILQQMKFANFTMMKVFIAATSIGMIIFAGVGIKRQCDLDALGFSKLGGLLVGTGMSLSGACPGTNLVQIGAGVKNSLITYSGQLAGALVFGMIYHPLRRISKNQFKAKKEAPLVDKYFQMSYFGTSLAFLGLMFSGLYWLEKYEPFELEMVRIHLDELTRPAGHALTVLADWFRSNTVLNYIGLFEDAWHPIKSGIIIGTIQLCLVNCAEMTLGNSSQYVFLTSFIGKHLISRESYNAYFGPTLASDKSQGQLFLGLGAVLGGYTSTLLSGNAIRASAMHASPLQAFFGGIVLMYGARLAGGCPSGHGLTGIAKLSAGSFVTVACMFIGGGATALLL